ncbi:MAG: superoxide dismutase [Flavobacteriia bacterium]|nr:superoxide dismutase [Flavobacteriia bacterium]
MAFELPKLAYAYDALEPHIDARTMEIHHSKHHQAYINNLNNAIAGTEMESMTIEEILLNCKDLPAIRNNGGGFWNHNFFWEILSPVHGGQPSGELESAIESSFGSFEHFKELFSAAAISRFGSGWAWLCVKEGKLEICSTANQDNPMMGEGCNGTPILALDVWEHAYYLHYQNRRPDYINGFFNVVNWEVVLDKYLAAK